MRAEVVALSLGAAFLYAATSVLQHQSASTVPADRSLKFSLLVELLRRPRWVLSNAVDAAAYVLQFLALRAGSLLVVQTLLVTGLLFALPLGAAASRSRPRLHDWVATFAVVAGLSIFLAVANPDIGAGEASAVGWVVTTAAVAGMVAILVVAGNRTRSHRAALLGAACGVLFGLTAALAKASGHLLDHGLVSAVSSWEPYTLVALALLGILLSQSAFQAGPLQMSLPLLTVADPVVAAAIGIMAFHEHIAATPAQLAVEALAVTLMVAGVISLSRSPLVAPVDRSP